MLTVHNPLGDPGAVGFALDDCLRDGIERARERENHRLRGSKAINIGPLPLHSLMRLIDNCTFSALEPMMQGVSRNRKPAARFARCCLDRA